MDKINGANFRISPGEPGYNWMQTHTVMGVGASKLLADHIGPSRRLGVFVLEWIRNGTGSWLSIYIHFVKTK